jgi:hypothetical protein
MSSASPDRVCASPSVGPLPAAHATPIRDGIHTPDCCRRTRIHAQHRATPSIYQDAITTGKDHPHAVRVLARAWIRVIRRCWLDGEPYDPAQHGALQRLTTSTAA